MPVDFSREFPADRLLHENLVLSAKRYPQNVAFRFGDSELTFEQLDRLSNQLSSFLMSREIERGDRVGILMGRCLETAVAVYGILKSGAAYVPIDPTAPAQRVEEILRSCEIEALISEQLQSEFLEGICKNFSGLKYLVGCEIISPKDGSTIECIQWSNLDDQDLSRYRPPELSQEDVAYIMFTSGSTGIPKGMVHSHRSGQAYARLTTDLFELSPKDRIANHAPLHFDICTLGYLSAPRAGATTVIVPEPHTRMPASMAKLIADEAITIWYSVPFALIQLLTRGALEQHDYSALRMVQYGGDPFSPKQIRALMDIWSGTAFYNIYGPAETNQCLSFKVPDDISGNEEAIPIGTPWDETQVRVVAEDLTSVTLGDAGELIVHSSTMMHGYWNNKELNDSCFLEDTVRWYRTGDLVSIDSNGIAHYHGRKDRRVKIRGNRIELNEIESAAMKHPAVDESAVYLLDQGKENERIELALLVNDSEPKDRITQGVGELISNLLPKFAIPDSLVLMERFPRTTSGKIDRKAIQRQRASVLSE